MAAFSALSGLAASIGPILGGILIEADRWGLGWRLVFWINVPVGLAALVIGAKTLPESRGPSSLPRLDLIGVGLSALGLLLVIYPLIEVSGTRPWPVWTYWSMAAGVVTLIGFAYWQRLLAGREVRHSVVSTGQRITRQSYCRQGWQVRILDPRGMRGRDR